MIRLMLSLLVTAALSNTGYSADFKLIDVDKLDLEYLRLNPNNRDPYAPEYTGRWKERAALKFNLNVLEYFYWDNNIHTETLDTGIVKTVGWEWDAGIHLGKYLDVFHYHHSRHIMDEPAQRDYQYGKHGSSNQFPVEDGFGIRFKFIPGKDQ